MIRNLSFGELFLPENTNYKKEMKRFFNLCVVLMVSSCVSLYHSDYSDDVILMQSVIDGLYLTDGLSVSFLGSRGSLFASPKGFYKCSDSVTDTVWFVYVVSSKKIPKQNYKLTPFVCGHKESCQRLKKPGHMNQSRTFATKGFFIMLLKRWKTLVYLQ